MACQYSVSLQMENLNLVTARDGYIYVDPETSCGRPVAQPPSGGLCGSDPGPFPLECFQMITAQTCTSLLGEEQIYE